MFVLEEAKSRKRPRSSPEPGDLEPEPIAKKQKSFPESCAQPRHRPATFWDTLSKVRLSRSALREFHRRNLKEKVQPSRTLTPKVEYPTGRARLRLKRFARGGGPDLSHLRGLANLPPPIRDRMSDYANSQGRKRSSPSSRPSDYTRTTSTKTTPYSGNFEQKLIDNGIYPSLYKHPDGRLSQKPANLSDIQAAQRVPRGSLSPSRFTAEDFEAFQQANEDASGETTALYKVLPFIAGDERNHRCEVDLPFNNLQPFDKDLSEPKPDMYHGAAPSAIHPRVRADLGPYIIPSKADTTRPAAPNFFVEGKSAQGRAGVAKRQVVHDGAFGARAIHELRNYRAAEAEYDNKARSFSATYHAGTGTLQTYATHITAPRSPRGEPEYHTAQTRSFAMTDTPDRFREGATAYRNDRDLAKTERDSSIAHANQLARQMPVPSPNTSFTTSRTSRSTVVVAGSNTSEDELARDEVTPVKRSKPASAQRSHDHALQPDDPVRASTSFDLQHSAETDVLLPPRHRAQSSTAGPESSTRKGSVDRPRPSAKSGQSSRDATEVSCKRMCHKDDLGWCVEHQGRSIFVQESRWTPCEKNGRQGLYCERLNVLIYKSASVSARDGRRSLE